MSSGVLSGTEPRVVFDYFEQICDIPHGSGNEERISSFIEAFAVSKGLDYVRDSLNNVIIRAPGTSGLQEHSPVILQGHMDMVAEKTPECTIDMQTEGLKLVVDGDYVTAEGTTLGGDDGIAVAFMLAILDDTVKDVPSISHPPLECIFTVDEEVGMSGASGLDMSLIRGRTMINLDSEDEGYLLVSCAGGIRITSHIPAVYEADREAACESDRSDMKLYRIVISGLPGGHSGCDINRDRPNAVIELARVLDMIMREKRGARLAYINGGSKDNVIPSSAEAVILCSQPSQTVFDSRPGNWRVDEYEEVSAPMRVFDRESSERIISAILNIPNGVIRMSKNIPDIPELSLSLGAVATLETEIIMKRLIRSNVEKQKYDLAAEIKELTIAHKGTVTESGDYPGWSYRENSPLRDLMIKIFEKQYARSPVIQAIHAGVECGMFDIALPGLDAVSIGPDMENIHTPNERLSISSTARVWNYLLAVLAEL